MQNDPTNKLQDNLGWIVAFVLMGGFFIAVVLQFPSVRDIACKPEEQDCLRQWVAALGGWAAVLAAIPTIYFLSRQVQAAADHQRINFALNVRANIALAAATKAVTSELLTQSSSLETALAAVAAKERHGPAKVQRAFSYLADVLSRPVLTEFETRIGTSLNYTAVSMHKFVDSQRSGFDMVVEEAMPFTAGDIEDFRLSALEVVKIVRAYADQVSTAADRFIEDMGHLGSRIR